MPSAERPPPEVLAGGRSDADEPGEPMSPTLSAVTDRMREDNTAYPHTEYARPAEADPGSVAARTAAVTRAAATVELAVGVWLAVSPWFVGSGGSTVLRWNDVGTGAVLALLSATRLVRTGLPRTPSVSFGLGAWTIVAAFVLSFQNGATGTAPLWNAIGCGAALTAAAAWSTTEVERAGLRRG